MVVQTIDSKIPYENQYDDDVENTEQNHKENDEKSKKGNQMKNVFCLLIGMLILVLFSTTAYFIYRNQVLAVQLRECFDGLAASNFNQVFPFQTNVEKQEDKKRFNWMDEINCKKAEFQAKDLNELAQKMKSCVTLNKSERDALQGKSFQIDVDCAISFIQENLQCLISSADKQPNRNRSRFGLVGYKSTNWMKSQRKDPQ